MDNPGFCCMFTMLLYIVKIFTIMQKNNNTESLHLQTQSLPVEVIKVSLSVDKILNCDYARLSSTFLWYLLLWRTRR